MSKDWRIRKLQCIERGTCTIRTRKRSEALYETAALRKATQDYRAGVVLGVLLQQHKISLLSPGLSDRSRLTSMGTNGHQTEILAHKDLRGTLHGHSPLEAGVVDS